MILTIGSMRVAVKRLIPPIMVDWLRPAWHAISPNAPEWEYLPHAWSTKDDRIKGWNDPSVSKKQNANWQKFLRATQGTGPLGIAHEASVPADTDVDAHHVIMAYGYVLGLAAHKKERLSLLDWGGGIGHYLVLSRCLMPELDIDYCCKDLPSLCCVGRRLLHQGRFVEHEQEVAERRFDLALASGSLQYAENWRSLAHFLASVSDGYLYVTRLPCVLQQRSFVAVQRMYAYGYETECMGWVFNREEFLDFMASLNLDLVREFLFGEHPPITHVRERPYIGGFLFKKKSAKT